MTQSDLDPEEREQLEALSKMVSGFEDFVLLEESGSRGALFPGQMDVDDEVVRKKEATRGAANEPIRLNSVSFFETIMDSLRNFLAIKGKALMIYRIPTDISDEDLLSASHPHQTPPIAGHELPEETQAELESSFEAYLRSMDAELSESTKIAHFTPDETKGDEKVQLNARLVENILESFTAQQGLPGPASNIISSLGLSLPKRSTEEEMH